MMYFIFDLGDILTESSRSKIIHQFFLLFFYVTEIECGDKNVFGYIQQLQLVDMVKVVITEDMIRKEEVMLTYVEDVRYDGQDM